MLKALFFPGNVSTGIKIIFCCILAVYAITELTFCSTEDLTADEEIHHLYGVKILKGDPSKRSCTTDDSKMPVSALNAIPRAVEQVLHPGLNKPDYGRSDTKRGRYITFIVSFFTLLLVFRWGSEWYGPRAGIFSMALLAFCPAWLGHSGLVTTDAYSVTIFLLVFYCLWKYLIYHSWKYFLLFAISLAIAQIVKQTFVHLYICIPLLLLVYFLINKRKIVFGSLLIKLPALAFINLLIINAGFLFYKTGQPLQDYVFVSKIFNSFQQAFSFMGSLPLPLPEPYLSGMDTVKYFDELGGGFPDSTFSIVSILGHKQQGVSYWYYYPVTLFYKTPVPVLLFFTGALIKIFSKANKPFFTENEILLLIPFIYFLVGMSFLNNIQAGERHILFLYAVIHILCGKMAANPLKRKNMLLISGGCTWMLFSVFSYWNCFISYTNEFIPDKKFAYRKVGNANLDFGQGGTSALQYMKDHPGVLLIPPSPQKGKFILSVSNYENGFGAKELEWVQQYEPVGHVRHSYLLIEVK
ncbi:MAG: glycosyltransferase family 39 protein [Chitinophagaceae bacterium]|nr:glycosyltransferase family 39 protein [Chitinophagaceae bacterium]